MHKDIVVLLDKLHIDIELSVWYDMRVKGGDFIGWQK